MSDRAISLLLRHPVVTILALILLAALVDAPH